jgi:hypothetical protein
VRVTGGSRGESERAQALVVPNIYQSSTFRSQRDINTAQLNHTPQNDFGIHISSRIVFGVRPTLREDAPPPIPIVALPLPIFDPNQFELSNVQANTTTRSPEGQLDTDMPQPLGPATSSEHSAASLNSVSDVQDLDGEESDVRSTDESVRSSFKDPFSGSESGRESRCQTLCRILNTDSEAGDSDSDDSVDEHDHFQGHAPNHDLPRQGPFRVYRVPGAPSDSDLRVINLELPGSFDNEGDMLMNELRRHAEEHRRRLEGFRDSFNEERQRSREGSENREFRLNKTPTLDRYDWTHSQSKTYCPPWRSSFKADAQNAHDHHLRVSRSSHARAHSLSGQWHNLSHLL